MVDEIEDAVVRPLEILEDEHELGVLGEGLEEAPPRGESLAPPVADELLARREIHERPELAEYPFGVRGV